MKTVEVSLMMMALAAIPCWAMLSGTTGNGDDETAASTNRFALDLFAQVAAEEEGNVFLSPASVSTALAMTLAGARGETATEMKEALRLSLPDDGVHAAMGGLASRLERSGEGARLTLANALWGQEGYRFLDRFLAVNRDHYGAGLRSLDFAGATEEARTTINEWVEEKTADRIRNLIKPGVLGTDTRLVLTNAIHFKGTWAVQFDPDRTRQEPFRLPGSEAVSVPMMHARNLHSGYTANEDVQALEMDYEGEDLSMVILLPAADTTPLENLESKLTPEALAGWLSEIRKRKVDRVVVPRFGMTCEYTLKEPLGDLGMEAAFSPGRADFSGMDGSRDLYLQEVVHKTFVEVNEEGTEAAAATGAVISLTSMQPRIVFRADRPFLFLIRDRATGTILFLGRLVQP